MKVATITFLILAFVARQGDSFSLDADITKDLEELIKKDELILSFDNIDPNKNAAETLLSVVFPKSKQSFKVILERKSHKVTIKTIRNGKTITKDFTVNTLKKKIKSLILVVNQKQPGAHITLYVNCVSQGTVETPISMRNMFRDMKIPFLEVYRDMKYSFAIDKQGSLPKVLKRHECPPVTNSKNDPNIQADQAHYRGDIPLLTDLDDGAILNAINRLTSAVNSLQNNVRDGSSGIDRVRNLIEECDLCRERSPQRHDYCQHHPCPPGVQCHPIEGPPHYKCRGCAPGYIGDGTHCRDIDECDLADPCFPNVQCNNLSPGYFCDPCPSGYTGSSGETRIGLEEASKRKQQCFDIDECDEGISGCVPNSQCQNVEGSYVCGPCNHGFDGNQTVGCHLGEGLCLDGTLCDKNAACENVGRNKYQCKCKVGWSGNGAKCGRDEDLDGWPDEELECSENHCRKDNCPKVPNSGQEDADKDGIGDACDSDADNDGILNDQDNCPLVPNLDQADTDVGEPDKVGDACDNCPTVPNFDQGDLDKDAKGDACDDDMDGDGILNQQDNCPKIANADQTDYDGDGVGDVCDNCRNLANPSQTDTDCNLVGDSCDSGVDSDDDGIGDDTDNCPKIPNSDQLDSDGDGKGDACDPDADGDNIPNVQDNCPIGYNPNQEDHNKNGVGDICEKDFDIDNVPNDLDNCPNNSKMYTSDFSKYQTVLLDPEGTNQIDPKWVIYNKGAEIVQTVNSDPGLAVGYESFGGVDFEGTVFVDTVKDDDYVGFVFGYQSNKRFYAVMWKQSSQEYWEEKPFVAKGEPGIQIKLIDSATGPGTLLRNALWHTGDTKNEVKLLWTDHKGWKAKTAYRWLLIHRPKIGLIRLRMFEGDHMVADSNNLFDSTLKGGRLGVLCFSQEMIIWSDLVYRCNDNVPETIYRELPENLREQVEIDTTRTV